MFTDSENRRSAVRPDEIIGIGQRVEEQRHKKK